MRFCALFLTLICLNGACEAAPPDDERTTLVTNSSADAIPATDATCDSKTAYAVHKGSSITWRVQKITSEGETTLTGMTAVAGYLNLAAKEWKDVKATLTLTGKNTESGNALRDERIQDYIFSDGLFAFELKEVSAPSLARKVGESQIVTIKGTLHIAGQTADIEMPALVEQAGQISITPAENFVLNIRSLEPSANGLNLVSNLAELLALVPGVEMKDEVAIDFNMELYPNCDARTEIVKAPKEDSNGKNKDKDKSKEKPETGKSQSEIPDLTPDKKAEEELLQLGLRVYENRCASCHLSIQDSNHKQDMHLGIILDHYTRNFPTHVKVPWPNEKEACAIQEAMKL